ncbi:MAG: transposase, partial [Ghiorsea sp.]|nr:transposase [Ghiorsea sp.]
QVSVQSGTSVRGRTTMSKIGNAKVRKSFFMPALVAMKYNPVFIEMRKRLGGLKVQVQQRLRLNCCHGKTLHTFKQ